MKRKAVGGGAGNGADFGGAPAGGPSSSADGGPSKRQKTAVSADLPRKWKEPGRTYSKGRFSSAEREALRKAIDEFALEKGTTTDVLISGSKESKAKAANANAWMRIVEQARLPA